MKLSSITTTGAISIALAMAAPAFAADGMNYNYIEGGYVDTEIDDLDVDGDGVGLGGSVEISDSLFVTAGYSTQEFDFDIDLDQWSIGMGGHMPLTDNLDLVGSVSYVNAEVDTPFGDVDDDGYGLGIGLRGRVGEMFEVEGGVRYVDLDDSGDDTSIAVGGRYYFTEAFAIGAGVSFGDDVTTWNAGVRFEF